METVQRCGAGVGKGVLGAVSERIVTLLVRGLYTEALKQI